MLILALGSLERVLRSRGSNYVLESSRFDEVLIDFRHWKLASNTTIGLFVRPVYAGDELACHVSRVWHRTLPGVSVPLPKEHVKRVYALDASRVRASDAPTRPV